MAGTDIRTVDYGQEGKVMAPERRVQLRQEARAAWAKKTPEERQAGLNRLFAEIGEQAADALREAFAVAFQQLSEMRQSDDAGARQRRAGP